MNELERSLTALLGRAAGEPPHDVELGSVLARARRQRLVLATQVGALALVLVVGVVSAVALQRPASPDSGLTQVPAATGSPTPASAASASPAPVVPPCRGASATAAVLSTQGAAGTLRWLVRVTSALACSTTGYPGFDAHAVGGWLGVQVRHGGFPDIDVAPRQVVVPAGGSLYAVVYFSDVTTAAGGCTAFDRAAVTLPGDRTPVSLAGSGCLAAGSVRVGPVAPRPPQ